MLFSSVIVVFAESEESTEIKPQKSTYALAFTDNTYENATSYVSEYAEQTVKETIKETITETVENITESILPSEMETDSSEEHKPILKKEQETAIITASLKEQPHIGDTLTVDDFIVDITDKNGNIIKEEWEAFPLTIEADTKIITVRCSVPEEGTINTEIEITPLPERHVHNFTLSETIASTCAVPGKNIYSCICGEVYEEPLPLIPHSMSVTAYAAPTTLQTGYEIKTCNICGYSEKTDIPVLPGAMQTDMCCVGGLNRAMNGAPYPEFLLAVMNQIQTCSSEKEAEEKGIIHIPEELKENVRTYLETYMPYIYYLMDTNITFKEDGILAYSTPDVHNAFNTIRSTVSALGITNNTRQIDALASFNRWLCETRDYCWDGLPEEPFSAYINGPHATCFTYTLTLQLLCWEAGIHSEYYASEPMSHCWNKEVFSDGSVYWTDVCYNDATPSNKELYLLLTYDQMAQSHTF